MQSLAGCLEGRSHGGKNIRRFYLGSLGDYFFARFRTRLRLRDSRSQLERDSIQLKSAGGLMLYVGHLECLEVASAGVRASPRLELHYRISTLSLSRKQRYVNLAD